MRENLFFSLRFRLVALVLLAVLPALMLLVYFSWNQRRQTLEEARQKARTLALVTSQQFDNAITDQEYVLYTLSLLPQAKGRDLAALNLIFADLLKKPKGVLGFRLADAQGRVLGGVPPSAMPVSYADRAWFRRLQETRRFQVSDFVIGKTIPQPIMPLAYPVLNSRGEIDGILVASLSVGWLEDFLKKSQLPPGTHALLVDRQGAILANYPHAGEKVGQSLPQTSLIRAMLDRQEGFVEAGCPSEGIQVIYAFTAVGGGEEPLKLAVGFEKALVLSHVGRDFLFHFSLLGLAAGLALAGSLAFGHLLVRRPVLRILEATRRVTAGDLEARTGLPAGKGELNRLGQRFDEMAASLQQREAERKRAEEALHRSEQKYRLLVGQIPAMVFQGYGDWSIDPLDEKVEALTGYSKEDFESRRVKWCDLIPAEDLGYATEVFIEALKTDKSYVREHRLRKKNGEIIWVQCRGQIFLNDQGKVDYISGVSFDVTQRRQAEEALLESEVQYRLLAENVIDVIWTMDLNWKFTYASPSCESLSGYKDKELVGMTLDQLLTPDSMDLCKKTLADLLSPENLARQEYPPFILPQLELRFKDGSRNVYIEVKGSLLKDSQGQPMGMVGVTRDITERKQLEEQFLQAQKMEAVGTLAGGIAHDFNNILTAILGNIGLAVLDAKTGPRVQDRLAQAEAACLRAQALSQQLLTFAKGGAPVKKLFSVAELLTQSTAFTCVGSPVRCETTFPENLWWLEADPGQIGQVFQNLTINAIQAMPTGGTIKVWAENLTLGTASDLPLSAGRYIKISVRDRGMGIPAEHLLRIFDPYFTTKQKGSGLGLASTYAIIKKHHGHIAVESKPGVETTFNIYLPAVEQQVTPQPEEDKELPVGKGKILVMDDEDMVREVLGRILPRLGYETEFAGDGGEAIERFVQAQGFGQAFAAVILDLTVPGGMGGKETLARLLEIDPRVKAVVSSGYSDDPIMADFQEYGFSGVIAKPYRISELGKILYEVIMGKS